MDSEFAAFPRQHCGSGAKRQGRAITVIRMFGKTIDAISSVGLRLRNEGPITTIWRDGQFMWARRSSDPQFIAARDAIVEVLKKGPKTVSALARETGKGIPTIKSALHRHLLDNQTVIRTKFGVYALAGTQPPYVSRGDAIVAALKKGPMSFQAIAREINNPPSSVPQFLEPLLDKGTVIRIERGIYALRGSARAYVPTCDAIVSTLTKKPMKLGALVQHVTKSTRGTRSRSSIRTVLSRLTKQGIAEQEQKYGKYRLVRRVRAARCGSGFRRPKPTRA
jgi:predicted transcriptional regulator